MKQQKQNYLYGTMILGVGTVAVKLIGALFKIPLTNILGGVGMSYFNVAYDLYYPLYALFVSGVPVAVSKLVSENMACGRVRDARRVLRLSLLCFLAVGAAGALFMYFGADWFTELIQNPNARFAVRMLSPAIFFGCITAAFRGYYQGLQDMRPTAVSQVVEAVAKLLTGLALAFLITNAGMKEFMEAGTVFGAVCDSLEQAQLAVLPLAAAGAVLGVTISGVCGALYLVAGHKRRKCHVSPEAWRAAPPALGRRGLFQRLIMIAVPVCVASVISNLTSFIDLISVMNRLNHAISVGGSQINAMYAGLIPEGLTGDMVASYLYGCYSGLAVPLYNLVPSLTATIGVSLLPAVAAAWAVGDRRQLTMTVESSLRVSALLAFPAGFGLCAMAGPIMNLLFFSKPMEATIIIPALRMMGISSIFVALAMPVQSILQALGRVYLPVRLLLIGGLLKLSCNFLLVGMPQLNIQAAPVGTLVSYLFVLTASLWALLGYLKTGLPLMDTFGKPALAAAGCAVAARVAFGLLSRWAPGAVATLGGVCAGGFVYLILVFALKTLKKDDVFMLPGGEKFTKLLEKHHLLG